MKAKLKLLAFFLSLLSIQLTTQAQIQVPTSGVVCLNDLAHFSYKPPAGKKVSSYQWAFGDGAKSQNPSPFYLYKAAGKYTVTVVANFSGGGSVTDQAQIEILTLPKVDFDFGGDTSFCQYETLRLYDKSKEVSSDRPIVERSVLWAMVKEITIKHPIIPGFHIHTTCPIPLRWTLKSLTKQVVRHL